MPSDPIALRSLLKRAYLGRINRMLKEGHSLYEARKAAAVFLPKRRPQAERCETKPAEPQGPDEPLVGGRPVSR